MCDDLSNKKITLEHCNTKTCTYCLDGICVNDQSPACSDYCPAINTTGLCRFEEHEKQVYKTGCLSITTGIKTYQKITIKNHSHTRLVSVELQVGQEILEDSVHPTILGYFRSMEYAKMFTHALCEMGEGKIYTWYKEETK